MLNQYCKHKSKMSSLPFSIVILISVFFLQVIGIPLPFRENQGYVGQPPRIVDPPHPHIQHAHQPFTHLNQNQPEVHQRIKRHEDRPKLQVHTNQGQQQGQQRGYVYDQHILQQQQQQAQQPYPWQYQNRNHESKFDNNVHNHNNNNKHRQRRDLPQKFQMHDWQMQSEEQLNPNGFDDGYCTSSECMQRKGRNNIRSDNKNGNKIPNNPTNVHPQGLRHENFGNKIPLPSQTVMPPPPPQILQPPLRQQIHEEEQFWPQQHNAENLHSSNEFYEYGPFENENYPNLHGEYGQFNPALFPFEDDPSTTKEENNIVTIRASGISLGDGIEIVRVVLDISDGDGYDDDETNLEVEDQ